MSLREETDGDAPPEMRPPNVHETSRAVAAASPPGSPARAAGQVALVLGLLVPLFVLSTQAREAGWLDVLPEPALVPVVVLLTGLVAIAVTTLVMRAGGEGWTSAHAGREGLGLAIGFGLVALAGCYAGAMVATLLYLALTGFDLAALAAEKSEVIDTFSNVPIAVVFPLALFVGVYEELLFRGFLLSRATRAFARLGPSAAPAVAVIVTSTIFGLAHAYQGPLGVVQTGAIGLVLGAVAAWRRSLWPCVVAHALIDTVGLFALKVLGPYLEKALEELGRT